MTTNIMNIELVTERGPILNSSSAASSIWTSMRALTPDVGYRYLSVGSSSASDCFSLAGNDAPDSASHRSGFAIRPVQSRQLVELVPCCCDTNCDPRQRQPRFGSKFPIEQHPANDANDDGRNNRATQPSGDSGCSHLFLIDGRRVLPQRRRRSFLDCELYHNLAGEP